MKQSYLWILLFSTSIIFSYTIKDQFDPIGYSEFLKPFIKTGDLVFDIGAHQGKKAASLTSLGARVVCFEPQPHLQRYLKNRFNNNDHILLEPLAIGEKEGVLPFYQCDADTLSTFSREWIEQSRFSDGSCGSFKWDTVIQVPIATLDHMIQKHGTPVFCKIDVENFEYEVLKGLSYPIQLISFEYACETEHNSRNCLERLQKLGYTKFNFVIAESTEFVSSVWLSASELLTTLQDLRSQQLPKIGNLLWGDIYAYYE
ncbi:MAG: FkbM family methyltransferase [Candidatus Dependentiae bacterium]